MSMHICKNLFSQTLSNPSSSQHHRRSHLSFAIFHLFSTSTEHTHKQLKYPTPISEFLVEKHQFSTETVSKAESALSHLKTPEKMDSVLSYLKGIGFSNRVLNIISSCAPVLSANLDQTIKPKIKIFQDLGFSGSHIGDIISHDTWILIRSADDPEDNRIIPNLVVLKNVLGSVDGVVKLLKGSKWVLNHDLEETLLPNMEYMKRCGVDSLQLVNYMYKSPRFFVNEPEFVQLCVEELNEAGFDTNSKLYLYAITAIRSMSEENWVDKLEVFRSLGFSNDDILFMFKKRPRVFAVSEMKIREVVQIVLDTGKYDISVIVKHPSIFFASVEVRLKPRLQVLEILENRNLLKKQPGFSLVYTTTDKEFISKFVSPNLKELGEISLTKQVL